MSSAPGPPATHEATSMKNIKILSQPVCMWMAAGGSFWNHSKPFQVGLPCHREQQQCTVPAASKKMGEASNSFWQLLPVTARRWLSRNCTLSPSGTFEFYSTLSTPMSQPNTWLLFCRISWDSTLGMTSILSAFDTQLCKNPNFPSLVKTYVKFSTARSTLIINHTTTVIKVTLKGNQSNDSNWWAFMPNPLLFPQHCSYDWSAPLIIIIPHFLWSRCFLAHN